MRVSTALGAIVLVSIITNKAISACRFLKVEGSYMRVSTVLGAIVLVSIITNKAISASRFLKMEGSYMRVFTEWHKEQEANLIHYNLFKYLWCSVT